MTITVQEIFAVIGAITVIWWALKLLGDLIFAIKRRNK